MDWSECARQRSTLALALNRELFSIYVVRSRIRIACQKPPFRANIYANRIGVIQQ